MWIWQLKIETLKYAKIFFWNNADSLDNGQILKKFENNPWIRITVLNYTEKKLLKLLHKREKKSGEPFGICLLISQFSYHDNFNFIF